MEGEVKITNATKVFASKNESVTALNGVDFEIPAGSFVSLIGPSGCGKTTLLRCIAGLETLTEGSIEVDGKTVVKSGSDRGLLFSRRIFSHGSQLSRILVLGLRQERFLSRIKILLMSLLILLD